MAGGRGIYNLLRGRLHSHSAQPKPLKNLNGQICQICGEAVGLTETGDIFVACNECAFPICRSCYEYERREGNQLCPLCKTRYRRHKGIARVDGDDDEDVVDDLENEFNYPIGNNKARHEWQGDDPGLSLSAIHESQQPIARLTNGQQVSGEIPSVTDNLSVSTSGPLGPGDKHVRSLPYVDPRQPGELAHALRFLASIVSQSFLAFGDILELHRKFIELSGGVNPIFELEELLDAAKSG